MSRLARNLSAFFLGVLLVALPMLSYAETIPATTATIPALTKYRANGQGSYDSAALAADNLFQSYVPPSGYNKVSVHSNSTCTSTTFVAGSVYFKRHYSEYNAYDCSVGPAISSYLFCASGTLSGSQCVGAYTCPTGQNWTLTGASCTRPDCSAPAVRDPVDGVCKTPACPSGQEMVSGSCKPVCVPPESRNAAGVCTSMCGALVVTSTGTCVKAVPCQAGSVPLSSFAAAAICSDQKPQNDKCPGGGVVIGTFEGKPICLTPLPNDPDCQAIGGTVTGTINGKPICSKPINPKCPDGSASQGTVNGQPVCSDGCPPGTAKGTINGVSSCYPLSPTTPYTTDKKGDGDETKKEETVTKDQTGQVTGSTGTTGQTNTTCNGDRCTTKKTTTDQDGKTTTTTLTQPKDDFCLSNPKSSLCTGTSDQAGYCEENADSASCAKMGTFDVEGALETKSVGISALVPTVFSSNASCPSDLHLPKGVTFTFSSLCQYASGIRPFVLITAWLAAAFFVLGIKVD